MGSVKSSATLEVKTPSMHFCVKSHHPQPANPLDHLSGADRHSLHVVSCEQVFTAIRSFPGTLAQIMFLYSAAAPTIDMAARASRPTGFRPFLIGEATLFESDE